MSPSPPTSGPSLTAYQLQHSREPGHTFPTTSSDLSPPSSHWDETRFCPEFPLPVAPFPGSTSCRFFKLKHSFLAQIHKTQLKC